MGAEPTENPSCAQLRPTAPAGTRPSLSLIAGTAAIVVAAAGALNVGSAQAAGVPAREQSGQFAASVVGFGSDTELIRELKARDANSTVIGSDGGSIRISRSSSRQPIRTGDPAATRAATQRAEARDSALAQLAELADERADEMEAELWVRPLSGYRLTATFGAAGGSWSRDHTGLDLAAPYGASIMSVAHGIVTSVEYDGAYGNKTVITHDDGTQTWYCHQANTTVRVGQEVAAGDHIGYVGLTGNTTGPHLHFEVRPDPETPIDPYTALVERGVNP